MDSDKDRLKTQKDIEESLKKELHIREQLSQSTKSLLTGINDIYKANKSILYIETKIKDLQKQQQQATDLFTKGRLQQQINKHKDLIEQYKQEIQLLKNQAFNWQTIGKAVGKDIYLGLKNNSKYFIEMDKAVKTTALSMGLMSKQSDAMRSNMFKTSILTNRLGTSASELAKMQASYSNEIGRAVILSNDANISMAKMAQGTSLGADGAAEMAANMNIFGISVTTSAEKVEEILNLSHSMGVNTGKVLKSLQTNLKLAQGYNFKEGIKGITEMTLMAEKFKINLSDISSTVEKVITPEGAVEMAANLQVLGGEWSKLGDTFKLMFNGRNDVKALQESIINATKYTAYWDDSLQQANISGLEMHRLREVAKTTGVAYEKLAESALQFTTYNKAASQIKMRVDPKLMDFIKMTSQQNNTDKNLFEITMQNGVAKLLSDLTNADIISLKKLQEQKQTLTETALQAKTFDETWKNIVNTLKSTLLPFFNGFSQGLIKGLGGFYDMITKKDFIKKMTEFGTNVGTNLGKLADGLLTISSKFPIGALTAALAGFLALKAVEFKLMGMALGAGFLSVAMPAMRASGMMQGMGARGPRFLPTNAKTGKVIRPDSSKYPSRMGMLGKGLAGAGVSIGGGMLSNAIGNSMENKTAGRWTRILGNAASGAGAGALMGGGIPGAIVGAILQGGATALSEDWSSGTETEPKVNDFIFRPGQKAQPISPDDVVYGVKHGGAADTTNKGGGGTTQMEHAFKPIKIDFGDITLKSEGNNFSINLKDDPILMRNLTNMVQETIRTSIGGGKLAPNVSTA